MKYVVFTFDDGRRDNYTYAYPVMKKYGITGTLFCTTGYIDGTWQKDKSWHSAGEAIHVYELKELQQEGWELVLHGDKFRSMKCATPRNVPTHMLDNPEQYITKSGRFIRAHSLDELPQIWDIFIGNMSVNRTSSGTLESRSSDCGEGQVWCK